MYNTKCCCQQSEKLRKRPVDCSPGQIQECHGKGEDHPCLDEEHWKQKDQKGKNETGPLLP